MHGRLEDSRFRDNRRERSFGIIAICHGLPGCSHIVSMMAGFRAIFRYLDATLEGSISVEAPWGPGCSWAWDKTVHQHSVTSWLALRVAFFLSGLPPRNLQYFDSCFLRRSVTLDDGRLTAGAAAPTAEQLTSTPSGQNAPVSKASPIQAIKIEDNAHISSDQEGQQISRIIALTEF